MLFKNTTRQLCDVKIAPDVMPAPLTTQIAASDQERSKAELRRQLYERIAQGNALAEAEEHARRMWNGR